MPDDFDQRLLALAERTMRIRAHCAGEDATRIYLVMPFLELLGYDVGDPAVIVPEHDDAIDFAVMIDQKPAIAIEAIGGARGLGATYARLRSYYDGRDTVGVGIATNGSIFEAFIDIEKPRTLDAEPFLRLDMAEIAGGGGAKDAIELLKMLRPQVYNRDAIAEKAYARGLREQLKALVLDEFRQPSDAFCRLLLERLDIKNPRTAVIEQHYRPILQSAMEQALIVPVLSALRQLQQPSLAAEPHDAKAGQEKPRLVKGLGDRIGDEVAAFGKARRRSA